MKEVVHFINKANQGQRVVPYRKRCVEKKSEGNYHRKKSGEVDLSQIFAGDLLADLHAGLNSLNATLDFKLPSSFGYSADPL